MSRRESRGRSSREELSVHTTCRLPVELHAEVDELARNEGRSFSQMQVQLLREAVRSRADQRAAYARALEGQERRVSSVDMLPVPGDPGLTVGQLVQDGHGVRPATSGDLEVCSQEGRHRQGVYCKACGQTP